ncbi:MAG: hypothetical protein V4751_09450 [Pseudomonadota bacterium]
MSQRRVIAALPVCMFLLVGCASDGSQPSSQQVLMPPGYAIIDDGNFRIRCGMTNVFLAGTSFRELFHADGSEKTRSEFCADHRSDTRVTP